MNVNKLNLNKIITFIYSDTAEIQLFEPIYNEAIKRGYISKMTNDVFEYCEIGVYCQHINFPQFSKFSVIMLHDITQGYNRWPDFWFLEPWNKYDLGILPNKEWSDRWKLSSNLFYARPRLGVYELGWPKTDILSGINIKLMRDVKLKEYGLDNSKRTVLYAPAWENDNKQDDFVRSMLCLDVNILIKQAPFNPLVHPEICNNIRRMNELHKNISNVTILDPSVNIIDAICASDILVSEESSTLCEAVMLGIPAVSVSNWLIPDVTPSRFPFDVHTFAIKCKKEDLSNCVFNIINSYEKHSNNAKKYSTENFKNIGQTSKIFMDLIDSCVRNESFSNLQLHSNSHESRISFLKFLNFLFTSAKREFVYNYAKRYPFFSKLLKFLFFLKNRCI